MDEHSGEHFLSHDLVQRVLRQFDVVDVHSAAPSEQLPDDLRRLLRLVVEDEGQLHLVHVAQVHHQSHVHLGLGGGDEDDAGAVALGLLEGLELLVVDNELLVDVLEDHVLVVEDSLRHGLLEAAVEVCHHCLRLLHHLVPRKLSVLRVLSLVAFDSAGVQGCVEETHGVLLLEALSLSVKDIAGVLSLVLVEDVLALIVRHGYVLLEHEPLQSVAVQVHELELVDHLGVAVEDSLLFGAHVVQHCLHAYDFVCPIILIEVAVHAERFGDLSAQANHLDGVVVAFLVPRQLRGVLHESQGQFKIQVSEQFLDLLVINAFNPRI